MKRFCLSFVVVLVGFGCTEAPTDLPSDLQPQFAMAGTAACPTPADVVVSTDLALRAAVAAASPGDVIAIDGLVETLEFLPIDVAGVTLTCASAGSGLVAGDGYLADYLIWVRATDVTIDRLTLDATNAARSSILSLNGGRASGLRVTDNTITAGPLGIMFLPGVSDAVIADNYVEVAQPTATTGIHIQRGGGTDADRVRITGNRIVAQVPVGNSAWGAIRFFGGRDVVIADNHVEGPWSNGYALALLSDSEISGNVAEGSRNYGFTASLSAGPATVVNNVFSDNRATGVGGATSTPLGGFPPAGFLVSRACGNTFIRNNLHNNGNVGMIFLEDSGANKMVANGTIVMDQGNFDCDSDGSPDPNDISGRAMMPTGGALKFCGEPGHDGIARFQDENLEGAVRASLGLSEEQELTCDLATGLASLEAQFAGISSLVGVQNLTGLNSLNLFVNSVTDATPLSGMTHLQFLSLNGNPTTDLSPLSGLTNLTGLDLGTTGVWDLAPLSRMTRLEWLVLGNNDFISDITPLSGLTAMVSLDIWGNAITDIGALAGLTNLRWVSLNNNPDLSDIGPLLANPGVGAGDEVLLLDTNVACRDVALLEGKGVFTTSNCPSPYVLLPTEFCGDFSPSSVATFADANLEAEVRAKLGAPGGALTCSQVSTVYEIHAGFSSITSLDGIQNLVELRHVELQVNSISDLGPLSGLQYVGHLRLEGNAITDVSPLSGLTSLDNWLDLSGNSITDVSALGGLTNLQSLHLNENSIADISALRWLGSLSALGLESNPSLIDIQPLILNAELASGDWVNLINVDPALDCSDVAVLRGRGVTVLSNTCP